MDDILEDNLYSWLLSEKGGLGSGNRTNHPKRNRETVGRHDGINSGGGHNKPVVWGKGKPQPPTVEGIQQGEPKGEPQQQIPPQEGEGKQYHRPPVAVITAMPKKKEFMDDSLYDWLLTEKGGAGSGNFGHSGRPGHQGGSASGGGSMGMSVEANDNVIRKLSDMKISGKLSSRSLEQRGADIKILKKLPLATLRRRQEAVISQHKTVWDKVLSAQNDADLRKYGEMSSDLTDMMDDYAEAVDYVAFRKRGHKEFMDFIITDNGDTD